MVLPTNGCTYRLKFQLVVVPRGFQHVKMVVPMHEITYMDSTISATKVIPENGIINIL